MLCNVIIFFRCCRSHNLALHIASHVDHEKELHGFMYARGSVPISCGVSLGSPELYIKVELTELLYEYHSTRLSLRILWKTIFPS